MEKKHFRKRALEMNIAAVLCGGLVFLTAYIQNIPLWQWIFGNIIGIISVSAATVSLILLWYLMYQGKAKILRLLAGFQVTMILLTVTFSHFPNIVILKHGRYLSLMEHQGHNKTIDALAWALLLGSIFILPALFYLIYSFQKKENSINRL
jgi:cytochrome d ubiquinol oxidase subunit II